MRPKRAGRMANSVDPDLEAVWSGPTLFAQSGLDLHCLPRLVCPKT